LHTTFIFFILQPIFLTLHSTEVLLHASNPIILEHPLAFNSFEGSFNPPCQVRRRKSKHLSQEHPASVHSLNFLNDLYEAWNKPEKAKELRAQLAQIEDSEE